MADWWRPPPGAVEWLRAVIEHGMEYEEEARARRSAATLELMAPYAYDDTNRAIANAALSAARLDEAPELNARYDRLITTGGRKKTEPWQTNGTEETETTIETTGTDRSRSTSAESSKSSDKAKPKKNGSGAASRGQ